MSTFRLVSDLTPRGDQPEAIRQLTEGVLRGDRYQTLLGVTGSGKTFTISNVIATIDTPVLVLSHNKTLAAQLYGAEFKNVKNDLKSDALGLSLGQQQRLCIARVIAVQPEVILMDESTSALDPIATLRVEELIAELKQDYTIVIVTHNMQQAARVSDYTGLFWLGELVEFSSTNEMFTRRSKGIDRGVYYGEDGVGQAHKKSGHQTMSALFVCHPER